MAPKKSSSPKCKNMMYTQQIVHMSMTIAELKAAVERLNPARYAIIEHSNDMDDSGKPIEPHVHVMMCFHNARYLTSIAKKLGDKPQYIKVWDERANNGFAYLLHATTGSNGKTQHEASEVTANFDYETLVTMEIPGQIAAAKEQKSGTVKTLLDMLYAGVKTKREVEAELSGSQYGRYRAQIEAIWAKRLQIMAEEWREEMKAKGEQVKVVWIYGPAGTGKTSLAKSYAQKAGQEYHMTGSSRDIFQNYGGEHTLIIDELRPKTIPYHDLLRILDPFALTDPTMAPSRYCDKAIACDLIIITTPYNPLSFYQKEFGVDAGVGRIDGFDQLLRRLTLTMYMNNDIIEAMTYNFYGFQLVPGTVVPNPYSTKNRPAPKVDGMDIYRDMLGSAAPVGDTTSEKGVR